MQQRWKPSDLLEDRLRVTGASARFQGEAAVAQPGDWLLLLLRTSPECSRNEGIDWGKASSPQFSSRCKQRDFVTRGQRKPTNDGITQRRKRPRESAKIYKAEGASQQIRVYTYSHPHTLAHTVS